MIICAKCGMIPAKCDCDVASPLQNLVAKQRKDTKLWFQPDTAAEAYFQKEIRKLHKAIDSM